MPKPVVDAISKDAEAAAASQGGFASPAAKSAVQGQVWKNRDKKWVAASKGALVHLRSKGEGSVRPLAEKLRQAFDAAEIRDYQKATRFLQEAVNSATDRREKGWLKQLLAEYTNF